MLKSSNNQIVKLLGKKFVSEHITKLTLFYVTALLEDESFFKAFVNFSLSDTRENLVDENNLREKDYWDGYVKDNGKNVGIKDFLRAELIAMKEKLESRAMKNFDEFESYVAILIGEFYLERSGTYFSCDGKAVRKARSFRDDYVDGPFTTEEKDSLLKEIKGNQDVINYLKKEVAHTEEDYLEDALDVITFSLTEMDCVFCDHLLDSTMVYSVIECATLSIEHYCDFSTVFDRYISSHIRESNEVILLPLKRMHVSDSVLEKTWLKINNMKLCSKAKNSILEEYGKRKTIGNKKGNISLCPSLDDGWIAILRYEYGLLKKQFHGDVSFFEKEYGEYAALQYTFFYNGMKASLDNIEIVLSKLPDDAVILDIGKGGDFELAVPFMFEDDPIGLKNDAVYGYGILPECVDFDRLDLSFVRNMQHELQKFTEKLFSGVSMEEGIQSVAEVVFMRILMSQGNELCDYISYDDGENSAEFQRVFELTPMKWESDFLRKNNGLGAAIKKVLYGGDKTLSEVLPVQFLKDLFNVENWFIPCSLASANLGSGILSYLDEQYMRLKTEFHSSSCAFEEIGKKSVYRFVNGVLQYRCFFRESKDYLKTHRSLFEFLEYDGDGADDFCPVGVLKSLPMQYSSSYDYEFICKLEEHFEQYVGRMFACESVFDSDGFCHTVAEEIFVSTIFDNSFYCSRILDSCVKIGCEEEKYCNNPRYTPDCPDYYELLGDAIYDYASERGVMVDFDSWTNFSTKEEYEKIKREVVPRDIIKVAEESLNEPYYDDWIYDDYMGDSDVLLLYEHPEMCGSEYDVICGTGELGLAHWFEKQFYVE